MYKYTDNKKKQSLLLNQPIDRYEPWKTDG